VTEEKKELNLPSTLESVDKAASEAENFARNSGFDEGALFAIDMAVREAVANAVKHGNKLDNTKSVEITLINLSKGLEVTVRDFGEGFEVEEVPDPTNPENLLKANGRGVLFMKTFMEEVEWQKHQTGGMIVKMCKLR
jgi:serine/threonine-protein kinase RsbW